MCYQTDNNALISLQKRREIARNKFMYKLEGGTIPLEPPPVVVQKALNRRTDNGKAYVHIQTRTNVYFKGPMTSIFSISVLLR